MIRVMVLVVVNVVMVMIDIAGLVKIVKVMVTLSQYSWTSLTLTIKNALLHVFTVFTCSSLNLVIVLRGSRPGKRNTPMAVLIFTSVDFERH